MIRQTDTVTEIGGFSPLRSIVCVLRAVVISYIFLIAAFAVLALIYTYTSMPQGYLRPAVDIISAISLVTAGVLSSRRIRAFGWLHGASAGLIATLLRIFAGILIFGSYVPTEGIGKLLATGIVCSMIGGILGVNLSPAKRSRNKKHRTN